MSKKLEFIPLSPQPIGPLRYREGAEHAVRADVFCADGKGRSVSTKPDVAVYEAYKHDPRNDHCEIAFCLGVSFDNRGPYQHRLGLYEDPEPGAHHIWSVTGQRLHERSNLIRISHVAHTLVHRGTHEEPQWIRLLCVAAKLEKRHKLNDPAEFDLDVMHDVSGKIIRGWLETFDCKSPWLSQIRDEAIGRIDGFEKECAA